MAFCFGGAARQRVCLRRKGMRGRGCESLVVLSSVCMHALCGQRGTPFPSSPNRPKTQPPISHASPLLHTYTQATSKRKPTMVRTFMPQPTREDAQVLLAKRFFLMGCLGLPWLWAVSVMYFWPKVYSGRSTISTSSSSSSGSSAARRGGGPPQGNPELRKWVGRSLVGAVVGFGLLFGWVILFQLRWREWGSGVLKYMISAPESYSSGW